MELNDKLKDYLVNSLMEDLERKKLEINIKDEVIEKIGVNNGELKKNIENYKENIFKLDDECCKLKKIIENMKNNNLSNEKELEAWKRDFKGMKFNYENILKKLKSNDKKQIESDKIFLELKNEIYLKDNKIKELEKSQDFHMKQYKELLDKYELSTAMNKNFFSDKKNNGKGMR